MLVGSKKSTFYRCQYLPKGVLVNTISSTAKSSAIIHILDFMGKLLTGDEADALSLSLKFELKWKETTIHFFFLMGKMLLNSFSLTRSVPQLEY